MTLARPSLARLATVLLMTAATPVLVACGGGGGGGGGTPPVVVSPPPPPPPPPPPTTSTPPVPDFVANEYPPSSELKNLCATVRTGTDPDGNPRPDEQGELLHELFWLRSWMDETYLYYDQVTDRDPNDFTDVEAYFDERLTTATTANGQLVDRFSYLQPTEDFEDRTSGAPTFTYGAEWARIQTNTLPRDWRVAYTQEGSPAATGGLTRGAKLLKVDGADFLNGNTQAEIDIIVDGLFPTSVGETHTFEIERPDGTVEEVTLESASLTIEPVNQVSILENGTDKVGYLHYTSFSPRTGEEQLFDAFTQLANEGVDDLVLDFRYNGGGLLALAAQIGYMVAGPGSETQTFYVQEFNAKSPNVNPVNGRPVEPIPFIDETVGFSVPAGRALPSVDLPRVFVLTTARSCSASEAVMNGLIGIGVDVVQIGTRTCGKSTGQFPTENCGFYFAPLHFRGVNAAGFGDFDTGFAPGEMTGAAGPVIPGCEVADDFANDLGDPNEGLLAAALSYAETGQCPGAATVKAIDDPALAQRSFSGEADKLGEHPRLRGLDLGFGTLDLSGTAADVD